MGNSLSLDAAYELLSAARRRYVLYYLLENEEGNIDGVALQIAAWEAGIPVTAVSEDDRKAIVISLVHKHIPKLADLEVAEYDARSGDVVTGARFEELRPFVDRARAADDATVIDESRESFLYSNPEHGSENETGGTR
ncbi:DUF7344 domain-containing protein [Halosolutus gelatinilyticus]|uniref:DUF7344 domain-containing protein n=1 Tax=Halosolutus gelatinilyticus TaxID=2931975 RepID=UPI001FF55AB0|nr:hypothetical protein [Halosolutus gelatinilyticus]